ncbi:tyrosine-type recombinase/integrase [uncultured Victivallis sp.]|uniref:tyrosine-type recombinase/integrase n=1 Tax=uncultured Victivallis sp. TaxID=354118 RepID=UPI00258804CC|nr:tyrosine-type recombinase/integrase [uncultured Victivallis sp.]
MKKQNEIATTNRLPYSNEELERMFQHLSPELLPNWSPHKLFIPALALYNGLRMSEACQLQMGDFLNESGVPCIQVKTNETTGCTVKNAASSRIIPIHPVLLRLGLLGYVDWKGKQLWPELEYTARQGYSYGFMKFFSRFNRKYVTEEAGKTFHSLRHNFFEALQHGNASDEIVRCLLERTEETPADQCHRPPAQLEAMLDYIQKVDYSFDIFALTGIKPWSEDEIFDQGRECLDMIF